MLLVEIDSRLVLNHQLSPAHKNNSQMFTNKGKGQYLHLIFDVNLFMYM